MDHAEESFLALTSNIAYFMLSLHQEDVLYPEKVIQCLISIQVSSK